MSEPKGEPPEAFPDVRTQPATALMLTAGLAAAYALIFIFFAAPSRSFGLALYGSLILGASLLILSYVDLRTGLLLDLITLPLILLGIGYAFMSEAGWLHSVAGAAIGYGLVAGIGYVWRRSRGYEGIGLGDAKLLAAGGAWVGAWLLPVILLIGSLLGLIAALGVSRKSQNSNQRAAIPFGPALSLGIWVAWCMGETLYA